MEECQKTIVAPIKLSGKGLHTGVVVHLTLKPREENAGIHFIRVDLPGSPRIPAGIEALSWDSQIPRCTTVALREASVHTVEHLMSALSGLGIDNLDIEIDNKEVPGLDGSSLEFIHAIKRSGIKMQSAVRRTFKVQEPIFVGDAASSIVVVPDDSFRVSYLLDYDHPVLKSQYFTSQVTAGVYETEIAPCRTFCLEEEVRELQSRGLGLGATYENSLVVSKEGVIKNQLRFQNEFARHKILDLIGDLYLLGMPIQGHVLAVKSGHRMNLELLKRIARLEENARQKNFIPDMSFGNQTVCDIHQIMRVLPHRYPFLLVDRIIELHKGQKATGVKNVTINEEFFRGHFPTRPVMPGVLMVEALAQVGGILVLTNELHHGKLALFMAVDKVKFRKLVEPGEQLILEVEVLRDRERTALLKGTGRVQGEIVVEAEILLSFIDSSFLDNKSQKF